jgi:hypothetical protein
MTGHLTSHLKRQVPNKATCPVVYLSFDRFNNLGTDGWNAIADALDGLKCLTNLNCVRTWRHICEGQQTDLQLLREDEILESVGRYLGRSASTLTRLSLRCAAGLTLEDLVPLKPKDCFFPRSFSFCRIASTESFWKHGAHAHTPHRDIHAHSATHMHAHRAQIEIAS